MDLQAGFVQLITVWSQDVQLTHLPVDLRSDTQLGSEGLSPSHPLPSLSAGGLFAERSMLSEMLYVS